MYVIIENGGKQYKAVEGAYIEIDLLPEEVGKKKTFDKVLLLSTDEKVEVGVPFINGVSVDATITSHFKGPKITIFKYRPKQRFRVKTGHRQQYTRILVDSIAFPGKPAEAPKKVEASESVEKPVEKKPSASPKKTTAAPKKPATASKKNPAVKKAAEPAKKSAAKTDTTKKSTAAKTKTAADKK